MIRAALLAGTILALAGCGGDDAAITAVPGPTVTLPPITPPVGIVSYNVQPCLDQIVTPGQTVAQAVVPDTVHIDLAQPAGFPNGRRLEDPVVDITLAILLLDLTRHPATTFFQIPLDPGGNDAVTTGTFPYLAAPKGNPPIASGSAASYDFRTDPDSAFVRVDRMGMPAVATAVIGSSQKIPYNEANPSNDAAGAFVAEIKSQLTGLHNALGDDLQRLNLKSCAVPI